MSSSPVTFTSVGGGVEKSSKLKPELLLFVASAGFWVVGMSEVPSREISGKAEAALSKSKSSFPPDPAAEENSPPRMSFSRSRKLLIVVVMCRPIYVALPHSAFTHLQRLLNCHEPTRS